MLRYEVFEASTAPGLACLSSAVEHFLLDRHGFEHGLDHQVSILDVLQADHARDQAHALGRGIRRDTAARGGRLVVLLHHAEAALELLFAGLDQRHRDTGIGERHRDAAAHGAGADDGDALDVTRLRVLPARRRSWPPRARRRTHSAAPSTGRLMTSLRKPSRSFFNPSSNGSSIAARDRLGGGERRFEPARLLGQGCDRIGEDRRCRPWPAASLESSSRSLRKRALLRQHLAGEGLAAGGRAFDDFLDQAVLRAPPPAPIGSPLTIILTASSRADHARQPLGTAGARQQAELHFGQAELARPWSRRGSGMPARLRGRRRARCRGWRRSSASASSPSATSTSCETRRLRRLAEFGDVGAGDEGAAGAGQHDRLHFRVRDRALHAFEDAAAHRGAQRFDRRTVDRVDVSSITFRLPDPAAPRASRLHTCSSPCRSSGRSGRLRTARRRFPT